MEARRRRGVPPWPAADEARPEESWASSEGARRSMLANRGRDTTPELRLRSAVHRQGLRFRVDQRPLADVRRRADLVIRRAKVAVFMDGCFWHGCPLHYSAPQANRAYWADKLQANADRDRETDRLLEEAGWLPLRFWEHDDPEEAAQEVLRRVRERRAS